jgi:hypothetical protein
MPETAQAIAEVRAQYAGWNITLDEAIAKLGQQEDVTEGLKNATQGHTAVVEDNVKKLEERNKELQKAADAETAFMNAMLRSGIELNDELLESWRMYGEEERGWYQDWMIERQKADTKQVAENEKTLDTMRGDWDEYFNMILSSYEDFGDMVEKIGRKMVVDMARNLLDSAGGIEGILGRMGIGGQSGSVADVAVAAEAGTAAGAKAGIMSGMSAAAPYLVAALAAYTGVRGAIDGYGDMRDYGASSSSAALGAFGKGAQDILGMVGLDKSAKYLLAAMGPLGWAASGGISAYDSAGHDYRKRMRRGRQYGEDLGNALEMESLTDMAYSAKHVIDEKSLYSLQKYHGIAGDTVAELRRLSEIMQVNINIIKQYGEASGASTSALQVFGRQIGLIDALSKGWHGSAADIAEAWQQVGEKVRELSIAAVTRELETGAASFAAIMDKFDMIDMDAAERTTLKYQATLEYLTSSTLPALSGELSGARDEFRALADEMDRLERSADRADAKVRLLRSDMALTEAQLRTLRDTHAEVNVELAELYAAMGLLDREMLLVSASGADAVSVFEALLAISESMQGSLDALAVRFQGISVSKDLQRLYSDMYRVAVALEQIAVTGQKLNDAPPLIDLISAATSGDLVTLERQLNQVVDALTNVYATAELLNASRIAGALAAGGPLIVGLQLAVTLLNLARRGAQNLVDVMYDTRRGQDVIDLWIEKLEALGPIAQRIAERMRGIIAPGDITGLPTDILGGGMSVTEAAGYHRQELERRRYAGMGDIEAEIARATDQWTEAQQVGVNALADELLQQWRTGALTTEEMNRQLQEAAQVYADGLEAAVAEIRERAIGSVMGSVDDILATAGMDDYGKQVYAINQQTEAWIATLAEAGATQEQLNAAMAAGNVLLDALAEARAQEQQQFMRQFDDIINASGMSDFERSLYTLNRQVADWREEADRLGVSHDRLNRAYATQRLEIIDNFFGPIISGITGKIAGLERGAFNLIAPDRRAAMAGSDFDAAFSAFRSADAGAMPGAWQELSSAADEYLRQMLDTYKGSAQYLEAYDRVMQALSEAGDIAGAARASYGFSEYERQSIGELTAMADLLEQSRGALDGTLTTMDGFRTEALPELREASRNTLMIARNAERSAAMLEEIKDSAAKTAKNTADAVTELKAVKLWAKSIHDNTRQPVRVALAGGLKP